MIKSLLSAIILLMGAICGACFCTGAAAETYYIRMDGGSSLQCDGLADAPYPGTGTDLPCAWNHPFWAVEDLYVSPTWRINGGDTIIIYPGSYMLGYGAPNTETCDPQGAFACALPPLPGGYDADHPTRILGMGWDQGCPNPPEIWGTERIHQMLDLTGTSNATIACLEITDHSGCVEFHSNPEVACRRDESPYGPWASVGIVASDSAHIELKDLNIHGLASTGIWAGRLADWNVQNVRIAGSGWVGWDGDIYGEDSNSGTLSFQNWLVEWNGCAETYPGQQPDHCWGQDAGGYGDGVGTGNTGGHWIIKDSVFRCNTSDGLDLLYAGRVPGESSLIEIKRTKAHSNGGNQVKTNGPTRIENCLMVGNCGYFEGKPFAQEMTNHCRAGGSALSLSVAQGNAVSVVNSTIAGQGDCLSTFECDADYSGCDGSEQLIFYNNIFRGYQDFFDPGDQACYIWFDQDNIYSTQMDYNLIYQAKIGGFVPIGQHDIQLNPLFIDDRLESFDGHLQSEWSPAVDNGLPVGFGEGLIPDHDLEKVTRPQRAGVDIGAFEFHGRTMSVGVFRPSEGVFFLRKSNSSGYADAMIAFGIPGDIPLAGDWDGGGVDGIGVYRNGVFYLKNVNETGYADMAFAFGAAGDLPVVGDWDGDGVDSIGVYRDGLFMLRNTNDSGPADIQFALGIPGDVPIAGNWDGTGADSCGVFRPTNGLIYLKNDNTTGYADLEIVFGIPGDIPIIGDWDGDGMDTIGVYRAGAFLLRNSNETGYAEMVFALGIDGDLPISGKWESP